MGSDQNAYDEYYSLFANGEENYKALIEGKVKEVDIGAVNNIYGKYQYGVPESSVQGNLVWLYKNNLITNDQYRNYLLALTLPFTSMKGWPEDTKAGVINSVNFMSDFFIPASVMVIQKQ